MNRIILGIIMVSLIGCGSQGVPSGGAAAGLRSHTTGSALANAGAKTIIGIINSDGTVAKGTGFSSRRLAKGRYRIFADHFGGCAAIFVTPTVNTAGFPSGRQIGCTPRFNVIFAVFGSRLESGFQFMIVRVP